MKPAATWFAIVVAACACRAAGAESGKALFEKRCGGCHSLDQNKEGPQLRGVYGRAAASVASFDYSEALKKAQLTWDDETLNRWLSDSEKLVPNTDMTFRVPNAAERKAIIEYLKHNTPK